VSPAVSVSVGSVPVKVTFLDDSGSTWNFRIDASMILTAATGVSVQVDQITVTITSRRDIQGFSLTTTSSISTGAALTIPVSGSIDYAYSGRFGVDINTTTASWTFTVSGTDSRGLPFTASLPEVPLDLSGVR